MKKLLLSLALVSVAASSFAGTSNRPIRHNSGLFIDAYGASAYDYDSTASGDKFDHYGNGALVGVGYQFNTYLAVEGEFGYFSASNKSNLDHVYQPAVALKAIAPLISNVNLFAKLGVAENIYHYHGNLPQRHKYRPLVGLGMGVSLSQSVEVDALLQSTIDHETINQQKSWTGNSFIGVGVTIHF